MRTIQDLESKAIKFWSEKLSAQEKDASIIPKLIETQEKFISLLDVADSGPFAWKEVLQGSTSLPANLFLKHLMVLSDVAGEFLKRLKTNLHTIFPDNEMNFKWKGKDYSYQFKTLNGKGTWSNTFLRVDGEGIAKSLPVFPAMEDVANFIMHAGAAIEPGLPQDVISKCMIGSLIGESEELETFVRQRYIWVSRITGGATSNALGQLAQKYVADYLKEKLPNWDITRKTIPDVSHNERTDLAFDIVAISPKKRYCAIEVSFQVTTNSVIERKGGQAQARQQLLHAKGHKIAYVIDGAGNFERVSAVTSIIQYSDCTVTFSDEELDKLVEFLISIDESKEIS